MEQKKNFIKLNCNNLVAHASYRCSINLKWQQMKLFLLLLITFTYNILAQNDTKTIKLHKTENIIIDGIIDDAWNNADSAYNFIQFQPYFGKRPSQKTIAKILTNEESLFCLIICYDKYDEIQNFTGKQDDISGDMVSIMLDTFGDNRTAYKFVVSASGAKSDCRLLDDARNRDYNWDGIWFADAEIYNWGFVVEMEIPFKSIQYDKALSFWGIDFDRWRSTNGEDIYWCKYSENEGQRISKFGKLDLMNFTPKTSGLNLEIFPVGIAKVNYLPKNDKYKSNFNAGLDVFYNPSEKLTFQLTANPDFAQIEADPYDFNISRYETYLSEKRPFFTEGNEVFSPSGKQKGSGFYSPLELFYSRRIGKLLPNGKEVPLQVGTRAFGRFDDFEYGGFFAMTGETDYKLDNESFKEEKAYFGSARIKKQILGNSSIGLFYVGKYTKENNTGVICY